MKEALLQNRGRRLSADIPSLDIGTAWFLQMLPAWRDDDDAAAIYGLAFDDGWSAFKRRVQNVISLPEAKGHEIEALDLAQNGDLSVADVAARLRARRAGEEVVPFPTSRSRHSTKIWVSGEATAWNFARAPGADPEGETGSID